MNKYATFVVILYLTACGAVDSSPNANEQPPTGVIILKDKGYSVSIKHRDMEVSEECPQVLLSLSTGNVIDTLTLCQVKLPEYRVFDARKDFAFIDFSNYQFENQILTYDLDLSLLRGASFMAQCLITITGNKFMHQGCKKR